ncbi:MAG: biotin transporter BioY [Myxococcales bacterium]|nr:biotin transporter BioY [Myxococcales bacterium]MCB9641908.1 biotin transporter BioY [Myxococcales bacterium]
MHTLPQATFADLWRPHHAQHARVYDAGLILAGSLLIALCAQIAIPLPFTPVPVTGQTFAVLLVGMTLGAWRGAASVLFYLTQTALGLPFLAGGKAGSALLLGATGGYLIGFVFAAWIVGRMSEHGWDRSPIKTALAMTIATALIFVCGLVWLSAFVPANKLLQLGLLPFLPGAVIKIGLATWLLPTAWKILGRNA